VVIVVLSSDCRNASQIVPPGQSDRGSRRLALSVRKRESSRHAYEPYWRKI
jgi:hypothetical protein